MHDTYYRIIRLPHHNLTILTVKKRMDKKPKGTVASRSSCDTMVFVSDSDRPSSFAAMQAATAVCFCSIAGLQSQAFKLIPAVP